MLAAELLDFLERNHRALGEFAKGDPEPLKDLYSRRDDIIIANPFGPPAKGWASASETMNRAAKNYRDGEAVGFELISAYSTAELAYFIETERYRSKIGGGSELVPFALRVTTIVRREDDDWRIALRHADPIIAPRAATSILGSERP